MKAKQTKKTQLSKKSYDNLIAELHDLEEVQLPAVVERIAHAREQGDLSENSEYKDAKDQQEFLEVRIGEINKILGSAQIVDEEEDENAIRIGSKVTLKAKGGNKATYTIIAEYDKSAATGDTISAVSPIGKALMGKSGKATISVETPAGVREFEIVDFSND